MKEENKKSKKKILLYYLILAACLLVIAAVTVTVIFTVNRNQLSGPSIDNPGINQEEDDNNGNTGDNNPGDGNTDNNGDDNTGDNKPGDDDGNTDNKPTGSDTSFGMPVSSATVTTKYVFAYDVTLDYYRVHQGMDFEAEAGTAVCAVLDGTVSQIVTDHKLGENYVTLTHANGVTTTYKYINADENLVVGNTVKRGDIIGTIAEASGMEMNQGEHLHFEIKVNGKTADPELYLDIAEK